MLRPKRVTPIRTRVADPSDCNPLRALEAHFLDWTVAVGLAQHTAQIRRTALDEFIRWADREGFRDPAQVDREVLEAYQSWLCRHPTRKGTTLARSTQVTRLNSLKAFFKWLHRRGCISSNPAVELLLPRLPRRLPAHVLTEREVALLLGMPDLSRLAGIRDRTILEVLYSTGMRRMELASLAVEDIDLESRTAIIRSGKGGRQRSVPLGRVAATWIRRYLSNVRPGLGPSPARELFLTDYGEPFDRNRLGDLVRRYVVRAGIRVAGACNLLRHACATHMLEHGADIRFIQQLLGHADLSTTQIYTHVSISRLRSVHDLTHPRGGGGPGHSTAAAPSGSWIYCAI